MSRRHPNKRVMIRSGVATLLALLAAVAGCVPTGWPTPSASLPSFAATPTAPSPTTTAPSPLPVEVPAPTPAPTFAPWPDAGNSQVLYARQSGIWLLSLALGQARLLAADLQITNSLEQGDPWVLSPDGRYLAFVRNAESQPALLTVVEISSGESHVVDRSSGRIDALSWSHDGSRLAFLVNQRHERSGELLEQNLRLYDVASRHQATLYRRIFRVGEVATALWLRAWVPGDATLYVVLAVDRSNDPGTLHALDVRGGDPRPVSGEYLLVGGQAVHASTSQVLVRRRGDLAGGASTPSPLYVAATSPDGSLLGVRRITPEDWFVGAVAWSPEGRRVVAEQLEALRHGTFGVHLWLLDIDGSAPRQLTSDASYREELPIWLPSGLAIMFNRWYLTPPAPAGLWALPLNGAEPRLVDGVGANPQVAVR